MCLRTANPKPIPRKVAMDMPKMPARIPGTSKVFHPLAVAIPQAVVGPPMLALEAKSSSFSSKPDNFPNPRMTAKWTVTCTNANKKILGAVFMTFQMLPLAPITAKKTCSRDYTLYDEYSNANIPIRSLLLHPIVMYNCTQESSRCSIPGTEELRCQTNYYSATKPNK